MKGLSNYRDISPASAEIPRPRMENESVISRHQPLVTAKVDNHSGRFNAPGVRNRHFHRKGLQKMMEREPFMQATPGTGHVNDEFVGFIINCSQTAITQSLSCLRSNPAHEMDNMNSHSRVALGIGRCYFWRLFAFFLALGVYGSGGLFSICRMISSARFSAFSFICSSASFFGFAHSGNFFTA